MINTDIFKQSLKCCCPRCGVPSIYAHSFTLNVRDSCPNCGLELKNHDSGDGPAVFLIFILGLLLVPLALWFDSAFAISLWLHAIIWTIAAITICIGTMQPLKAYFIALDYKHRGGSRGL